MIPAFSAIFGNRKQEAPPDQKSQSAEEVQRRKIAALVTADVPDIKRVIIDSDTIDTAKNLIDDTDVNLKQVSIIKREAQTLFYHLFTWTNLHGTSDDVLGIATIDEYKLYRMVFTWISWLFTRQALMLYHRVKLDDKEVYFIQANDLRAYITDAVFDVLYDAVFTTPKGIEIRDRHKAGLHPIMEVNKILVELRRDEMESLKEADDEMGRVVETWEELGHTLVDLIIWRHYERVMAVKESQDE